MNVSLPVRFSSVSSTDVGTFLESRLLSLARTISTRPWPIILGLMLALVATVGSVDYATGLELSVSLLYLIPIIIGTWVAGRSMGYTVALASAGVWFAADFLKRHTYGHWFLPVWNTLTLAISFLLVAALL